MFDKLPLESQSSSLSNLVTLATPGISADSNGLFHGLGEHAEASFSVDGQPITDQQSKIFSNQIPLDSIQSMEVIAGAPPAEYGDKTSVVINVTTRSGQGVTTPHGSVTASYGSFGTSTAAADLSYGGQNWGNFISVSGLNSGRFLDPPEFVVLHDKGNEENVFDRVDYQITPGDSIHLNFGYTRSWFQTPNTFDSQNATPWNCVVVVQRRPWTLMAISWDRRISVRRSKPSTSRHHGRGCSALPPCLPWVPLFAGTNSTTTPAAILLPTSAPSTFSGKVSDRIVS